MSNDRLKAHRLRRGWSQEDVAHGLIDVGIKLGVRQIGVTASLVSRWERGLGRPRSPYPRLLCELFKTTADDLGLVDESTADDEVNRRGVFRMLGGMAAIAVTPSAIFTFEHPDREALEVVTHSYRRLWATTPPERLLGPVLGHLHLVAELPRAATETAVLAGTLHRDLGQFDAATCCYRLAWRYAQDAGKPWQAFVLGEQSYLSRYMRDTEGALAAASHARRLYHSDWTRLYEAVAYAQVGNSSYALSLLDKIEPSPYPEPPHIYPLTENELGRSRGMAARMLGLPREAIPALEAGLEISKGKRRARLLYDLAACRSQLGELDAAEADLSEALTLADGLGFRLLRI